MEGDSFFKVTIFGHLNVWGLQSDSIFENNVILSLAIGSLLQMDLMFEIFKIFYFDKANCGS